MKRPAAWFRLPSDFTQSRVVASVAGEGFMATADAVGFLVGLFGHVAAEAPSGVLHIDDLQRMVKASLRRMIPSTKINDQLVDDLTDIVSKPVEEVGGGMVEVIDWMDGYGLLTIQMLKDAVRKGEDRKRPKKREKVTERLHQAEHRPVLELLPEEPKVDLDTGFEVAWGLYPKRDGSNSKHNALLKWRLRRKEGVDALSMIRGVERYAAHIRARGMEKTGLVMQAERFFGKGAYFAQEWPSEAPKGKNGSGPRAFTYEPSTGLAGAFADDLCNCPQGHGEPHFHEGDLLIPLAMVVPAEEQQG